MSLNQQSIPFEDLARINQNGEMVKLLAAPLAIVCAVLVMIAVVRTLQRIKERRLTQRYFN